MAKMATQILNDELGIENNVILFDLYFKFQMEDGESTNFKTMHQQILLSLDLIKYNERLGIEQRRVLVVTDQAINLLRRNSFNQDLILKRRILHKDFDGISKNLSNQHEFLLHVSTSHDLRLRSEKRDLVILSIKQAFVKAFSENIPVFGIPDVPSLRQYTTTFYEYQDGKQRPIPDETLRLPEEDLPLGKLPHGSVDMMDQIVEEDKEEIMSHWTSFKLMYTRDESEGDITLQEFEIINLIGRGSISNVYLIRKKSNNQAFAMKCIQKELVVEDNLFESTKLEKDLLIKAKSPFFLNLHYSFQSETRILFIMNFVRGGDLFMHLNILGPFSEELTKFVIAQLTLALGYLHENNILYRDLKLENILLNEDGYISLVDFGISKLMEQGQSGRTFSVRGTPEYMAPEILTKKGHSFPVDWWALGTIAYEILVGTPPFFEDDQAMMFKKILKKSLDFPEDIPLSEDCKDFIGQLLHKDPNQRLGNSGYHEILEHPFFKDIDFDMLYRKEVPPPYKPQLTEDIFDVSNFEQELTARTTFDDGRVSVSKAEFLKGRQSMFRRM